MTDIKREGVLVQTKREQSGKEDRKQDWNGWRKYKQDNSQCSAAQTGTDKEDDLVTCSAARTSQIKVRYPGVSVSLPTGARRMERQDDPRYLPNQVRRGKARNIRQDKQM
jgi:hypothetical protein